MLVYGDRWRTVSPDEALAEIGGGLAAAATACKIERRDHLTRALIDAGELAQAIADAEFERLGEDHPTPAQTAALDLAMAIARQIVSQAEPAEAELALRRLGRLPLPPALRCKTPEGYAFYAVYPEAYAAAAKTYAWPEPPLVIGLRSIGTSLAAVVTAATGGRAITVRPTGHPFRRELRLSAALEAQLAAHQGPFAVVDEGPGLSGSSFGAVADRLESLGVAAERIVFLPSHAGDLGLQASSAHRARWARSRRLVADAGDLQAAIVGWFADLVGPVSAVEDLSGGAWRGDTPADQPPAAPSTERLKFRLTTPGGRYLARFAGLGRRRGEACGRGAPARGRLHSPADQPAPRVPP